MHPEVAETLQLLEARERSEGYDPFGFRPQALRNALPVAHWVYRHYFRADAIDIHNVPEGRVLLIANHSGQLPFDGAMIATALLIDRRPPRMVRGMIEKFVPTLPFIYQFFNRAGQVVGTPDNARALLGRGEPLMVFPEGSRGISKTFDQRYQLTEFGLGFMRLALETDTPIIPIGVVGAEEQLPSLYNAERIGRLFGSPAFPIVPNGFVPLPVKYRIYFGELLHFEGDSDDEDRVIRAKVDVVVDAINSLIRRGLRERKDLPLMARRRQRRQTIVMTGIAGRFGRMMARTLHQKYHVIGIDPRGAHHMPNDVTVHAIDIRRKKAEDIFRRNPVDAVIHLNPTAEWRGSVREHQSLAVVGTHKILEYCQKYEVTKAVVLSTAAIYGARPENNQFLTEEAPLLAGLNFHTMRDLVEVDMYAQSFFWRHPEVDTVVLRPVHIVGRLNNAVSQYLMMRTNPTLLGFDPMVQVMSPEDLIHAIQRALKPGIRGVFNIAGPKPAPLSEIIRKLGHRPLPLPEPLARAALRFLSDVGTTNVPTEELAYLKYVCMVDDTRAREVLRFKSLRTLDQTLEPLRV